MVSHPTPTSHESGRLWCRSSLKSRTTKREAQTTSSASFDRWQRTQRATARNSSNPQEWAITMQRSTTMPRLLYVCARKQSTNPSDPTVAPTRRSGKRLHSSSLPLSETRGCGNSKTRRIFTLTSRQRRFFPTSKWGAQVSMPSTSWYCIIKCSAITLK